MEKSAHFCTVVKTEGLIFPHKYLFTPKVINPLYFSDDICQFDIKKPVKILVLTGPVRSPSCTKTKRPGCLSIPAVIVTHYNYESSFQYLFRIFNAESSLHTCTSKTKRSLQSILILPRISVQMSATFHRIQSFLSGTMF